MQYLIRSQHKVAALKPIASGTMPNSAINEDIAQLLAATNYQLTPQQINLITFTPPICTTHCRRIGKLSTGRK